MALPRPYYSDEAVTLYHGEAAAIVPHLPRADAVITDPPYGETSLEWDVWPRDWPSLAAALAPQLWCFGSMRMFWDHRDEFASWKLAQDIVWEKQNGSGFANDRFKRVHEFALHFYRGEWVDIYAVPPLVSGDPRPYVRNATPAHTGSIGSFKSPELRTERIQRSVIKVANCHGYAVNETQKPEGIVRPLVLYSVPPGGLAIDLFAGSGTTLAVARSEGRRAISVEKRESQCAEIAARLRQRDLFLAP